MQAMASIRNVFESVASTTTTMIQCAFKFMAMALCIASVNVQAVASAAPTLSVPFEKSEAMSWKTEYVGRVQMNFPLDRPRSWSNEFDMAVVKRLYEMPPETFWQGVEVVRKRYENQKHRKGGTRLAYFEKVGDNAAHIFNYDDTSYWAPDLHRYVHLDNQHAYEFKTGALGTKGVEPSPSLFKPFVATYSPIFSRIHPLKEGQAPERDGLAIDGAVVSGETGRNAKAGLRVEIATGTFLSIAYRENHYQVLLRNSFEELAVDENLAKKMAVYDEPRAVREFKVLRRQERTLGGISGQEFIAKTTLKNGHSYYRFNWQVKGANDGELLEPTIAINLNTPKYPKAHPGNLPFAELPPETELIKLWEFAIATFKWRPGALPNGQTIKAVN